MATAARRALAVAAVVSSIAHICSGLEVVDEAAAVNHITFDDGMYKWPSSEPCTTPSSTTSEPCTTATTTTSEACSTSITVEMAHHPSSVDWDGDGGDDEMPCITGAAVARKTAFALATETLTSVVTEMTSTTVTYTTTTAVSLGQIQASEVQLGARSAEHYLAARKAKPTSTTATDEEGDAGESTSGSASTTSSKKGTATAVKKGKNVAVEDAEPATTTAVPKNIKNKVHKPKVKVQATGTETATGGAASSVSSASTTAWWTPASGENNGQWTGSSAATTTWKRSFIAESATLEARKYKRKQKKNAAAASFKVSSALTGMAALIFGFRVAFQCV